MKLLILSGKSQEKRRRLPFLLKVIPTVSSGRPKGSGAPQLPAGFPADSGTVSRHGCGVPFRTSLWWIAFRPCSGISHPSGRILQKSSLPFPVVCIFQQRLLSRENKIDPPCICFRHGAKGRGSFGGGGIGIGGGTMLQVLGIVYPILIGIILLQMALSFFSTGTVSGELWRSLLSRYSYGFFSTAACCSVWHVFRQRFAGSEWWPTNLRGS